MIGYLKGRIHARGDDTVVVTVSDVGYEVLVSRRTMDNIGFEGESVELEIHTHVGEGIFQLIGFLGAFEKNVFKKLIAISGVGPRMALSLLSGMTAEDLVRAVVQGDLSALTAISGVGKKTAERLVIELKDKFKEHAGAMRMASGSVVAVQHGFDSLRQDAFAALMALGYPENVSRKTLQDLSVSAGDNVQAIIKKSLGVLAR